MRVNLTKLKDAVAPFPQRCIHEIHQLLPRISAAAYDTFVTKIQDYTARLSQLPNTPEEFAEFLQLLREVEQQQKALDKEYDQVQYAVQPEARDAKKRNACGQQPCEGCGNTS